MILTRFLIFFDLETTGVSLTEDRIVQIGAIKVHPDGAQEEKNILNKPNHTNTTRSQRNTWHL